MHRSEPGEVGTEFRRREVEVAAQWRAETWGAREGSRGELTAPWAAWDVAEGAGRSSSTACQL